MHVCYIFLRDILIFILDGTNGSLPEYVRAIATDTALSEDVVPLLVLGGIFLVMPIISGAFIALVHLLMVRSPKWVQITAGAFTVLVAGAQLPAYLGCSGAHGALAVFVVVTASLERTARLLGRNRGDDVASFSEKTTTSAPQPSKTESGTPPRTGSKKRKSTNTDPSKSCPGQPHHPHDRVDYSGKLLHAARLRVLHGVLIRSH